MKNTGYVIHAKIETYGRTTKSRIFEEIVQTFQQVLGRGFDIRKLQKTGKIEKVEINTESTKEGSAGEIKISSNLSDAETAILAAALETLENIGPHKAEVVLIGIEDTTVSRRKKVIERAKEIITTGVIDPTPTSHAIREGSSNL
ncbi:MAG: hypothetical protein ACE5PM_06480 [Candidatus Hydrothermarchaeales archaeon]